MDENSASSIENNKLNFWHQMFVAFVSGVPIIMFGMYPENGSQLSFPFQMTALLMMLVVQVYQGKIKRANLIVFSIVALAFVYWSFINFE